MWSFVSISFESWMTDFKEHWISLNYSSRACSCEKFFASFPMQWIDVSFSKVNMFRLDITLLDVTEIKNGEWKLRRGTDDMEKRIGKWGMGMTKGNLEMKKGTIDCVWNKSISWWHFDIRINSFIFSYLFALIWQINVTYTRILTLSRGSEC